MYTSRFGVCDGPNTSRSRTDRSSSGSGVGDAGDRPSEEGAGSGDEEEGEGSGEESEGRC
jgi:hypothetical protein